MPIAPNDDFRYHQELIVSVINPNEIKNKSIQTRYNIDDAFYTAPGQLYSHKNAFIYVQTYYKQISNSFVPVFNIVKNLELVTEINDFDVHFSILDNKVFLYDFMDKSLVEYKRNYRNIDTTRLMIDHLEITINSNYANLYGYRIDYKTTLLNVKSSNIEKMKYLITYLDPFVYDELIVYLNNSFIPIAKEKQYHRTDIQLIGFRIFENTKHISYYNDRYYLYMANIADISHQNIKTYINHENGQLIQCEEDNCTNLTTKVLTNHVNIKNLNKQFQIFYTDTYNSSFPIVDNNIISILTEGNQDFSGQITFSFDIKSINQYFDNESIIHETLSIIE